MFRDDHHSVIPIFETLEGLEISISEVKRGKGVKKAVGQNKLSIEK